MGNVTKRNAKKEEAEANIPAIKEADEGYVYIHNMRNATFHVPLVSNRPEDREDPIIFLPNQVLEIETTLLKHNRFKKCFDGKFLEIFNGEEYAKHQASLKKARRKEVKQTALGLYEASGLPLDRTMAINQVNMITDDDLLEALLQKEDRPSVLAAIEERIEAIENGEVVERTQEDDDD